MIAFTSSAFTMPSTRPQNTREAVGSIAPPPAGPPTPAVPGNGVFPPPARFPVTAWARAPLGSPAPPAAAAGAAPFPPFT